MTVIATLQVELKTNDEQRAAERAWALASKLVAEEDDIEDVRVVEVL